MAKIYTEADLGVLVAGEWGLVGGLGAALEEGVGIVATRRAELDPVWNHPEDVALPFPFTLTQFRAFCAWHPFFEWEAVESPFTNDDGSLNEDALAELAKRGTAAADLVRRFLGGDSDDETFATQAAHQAVAKRKTVRHVETGDNVAGNLKWTPERLAEVTAYREKHGTRKAAKHFGISEQLIRAKLPRKPLPPKGYSVFAHRMK